MCLGHNALTASQPAIPPTTTTTTSSQDTATNYKYVYLDEQAVIIPHPPPLNYNLLP